MVFVLSVIGLRGSLAKAEYAAVSFQLSACSFVCLTWEWQRITNEWISTVEILERKRCGFHDLRAHSTGDDALQHRGRADVAQLMFRNNTSRSFLWACTRHKAHATFMHGAGADGTDTPGSKQLATARGARRASQKASPLLGWALPVSGIPYCWHRAGAESLRRTPSPVDPLPARLVAGLVPISHGRQGRPSPRNGGRCSTESALPARRSLSTTA